MDWIRKIYGFMAERSRESELAIFPLSILAVVGYIGWYFYRGFEGIHDFEDFYFRLSASVIAIPFLFYRRWPSCLDKLKPYFMVWILDLHIPIFLWVYDVEK